MANPTKPKDAKPKAEDDGFEIKATTTVSSASGGSGSMVSTIAVVAIAAVVIIITNYFLVDMKLAQVNKNISNISVASDEGGADANESVTAERGIILDLGEFILNLSDVNSRRFLKVNVAVELTQKPTDSPITESKGHGEKDAAMSGVEAEMNQFKPSIRDSIISVLSSKTSEELNTTAGKELAKEQIKEAIDAIFEGDREVLRVSFGSFFIQ